MDVRLPDGTVIQGVPEGMSKADLVAKLKTNGYDTAALEPQGSRARAAQQAAGVLTKAAGNIVPGAVRGAGSIGATILSPFDKAGDVADMVTGEGGAVSRNDQRRSGMDAGLTEMGADPSNPGYKLGKLGGEVMGTLGVGGGIARAAESAAPVVASKIPNLLTAIRTSGMRTGAPGTVNPLVDVATRATGGAITGGASAGLVNPEQAVTGAELGGALPVAAKVAGELGTAVGNVASTATTATAKRLMQSAIKPTIAQIKSGDAATAVETLLGYGINPTEGGVNKLRALIDAKNTEIANEIAASGATVDKQNVLGALGGVRQKFGNQVSPTGDLASIQRVADDFAAHPNVPGNDIPVQVAQDMKQGTYRVLKDKYGQMGSAETEAQKGLARGLKDEIATAVPAVGPLNAEESRLITTLNVSERRALMEMNKNPMGLAALAHNPMNFAMFMADKSALFKSLAARLINSTASAPNAIQQLLGNQTAQQIGYRAAPAALTDR